MGKSDELLEWKRKKETLKREEFDGVKTYRRVRMKISEWARFLAEGDPTDTGKASYLGR